MAARIIHFGADNCHRLWVLKSAGYFIDDCQSVVQLRTILQSGIDPDAVAFTESERFAPEEAVEVARSHSSAPLILFRETHNECAESAFDLVVPVLEPPEAWLNSVAALIARGRPVRVPPGSPGRAIYRAAAGKAGGSSPGARRAGAGSARAMNAE
jgi:hypothetical protein